MTYHTLIATLADECRSRHEGPVPTVSHLLRESWISTYLRVMFPVPARPLETDALCPCGHAESAHPMQGDGSAASNAMLAPTPTVPHHRPFGRAVRVGCVDCGTAWNL